MPNAPERQPLRVAGLVVARQRPPTAKGHVFLSLEDETGLVNVILRPKTYQTYRQDVRGAPILLIDGKLRRRDGALNLTDHRELLFAATGAERAESTFSR